MNLQLCNHSWRVGRSGATFLGRRMIRFKDGKAAENWGLDNSEQALSAEALSK